MKQLHPWRGFAGKGHEKYQEIKGVKHPFDDFEILKETLKTLNV